MPYPSARSLVRILSLSTSALGHPNETIPMFGCSELFSLFNDTFAWSGLFNEGLELILLVEADIGLAPYPNMDYGFSPLKIYEYMGCKLPVVATSLPSVKEATKGHALLVNPGQMAEAISKIISNKSLLTNLSDSAFRFASKERTWSNTIDKTIDLYNSLV